MTPALATRTSTGPRACFDRREGRLDLLGLADVARHGQEVDGLCASAPSQLGGRSVR